MAPVERKRADLRGTASRGFDSAHDLGANLIAKPLRLYHDDAGYNHQRQQSRHRNRGGPQNTPDASHRKDSGINTMRVLARCCLSHASISRSTLSPAGCAPFSDRLALWSPVAAANGLKRWSVKRITATSHSKCCLSCSSATPYFVRA